MFEVRDISLAGEGRRRIDWVKSSMPLMARIESDFDRRRPFEGVKISISLHVEAKTARFALALAAGGARVRLCGCNPLSTQDAVAAALAESGMVEVFAVHGESDGEYVEHLERTLDFAPHIIIDDGGDLAKLIHTKRRDLIPGIRGGCEETTTGVTRLRAMERAGALMFPMIDVNDADMKHLFDNRHGTGQSVWDGIMRTTNLLVAGKTVVVAGYGLCGRGVAMRAKGLGACVVVTEIDETKALEAAMDGFSVLPMEKAAPLGDFFITVTGCRDVISGAHFGLMKDGAILANAGHFDVEISLAELAGSSISSSRRRHNITGYTQRDGRVLNLLSDGRLVNLASGDGHPAEIMDMSFSLQALSAEYLNANYKALSPNVISVPHDIDRRVASMKLESLGLSVDVLTPGQKEYLESF